MKNFSDIEKQLNEKVLYYYETDNEIMCLTESPMFMVKLKLASGGTAYPSPVIKTINKQTSEITETRVDIYGLHGIGLELHPEYAKEILSKFRPVHRKTPFRNYYDEFNAISKVLSLF